MQATLVAINQELSGNTTNKDKLLQLLGSLLQLLKHQTPNKSDVPSGTISIISSVLCTNAADGAVALAGVKCLQQVMHLLGSAGPVMRLEGGLRALLVVLQSSLEAPDALKPCLHLMTQLSTGSNIATANLVDLGALTSLMELLDLHSADEPLLSATTQLLVVLSKSPKGATKLCELQLVSAVARLVSLHGDSVTFCGAALKLIRRVAKQPACRESLLAAGAVQLLLETAHKMAALEGQQQQVKRACRALWLLCPGSLISLPPQQPYWPVPNRSSPHLNLQDAMGNDVQRLQELFPELQAAFVASQPAESTTAAPTTAHNPTINTNGDVSSSAQHLPKLGMQGPVVPPSVEQLMQHANVENEPFHPDNSHLVTKYLLHDLLRLQDPGSLLNRVVYDNLQPQSLSLQQKQQQQSQGFSSSAALAGRLMPTTAAPAAVIDAPHGVLQFTSGFETANLGLAVQVRENEYDLFLSNDLNDRSSNGNSAQWFYFGIWNAQPGRTYKLNLVNFIKPESLYTSCKQPLMCCAQPTLAANQPVQDPVGLGSQSIVSQQRAGQTDSAGQVTIPSESSKCDSSGQRPQQSPEAACSDDCQGGRRCSATHHAGIGSSTSSWHRVGQNVCYYASPYRGRPGSNMQEKGSIAGSTGSSSSSNQSRKSKGAHAKSPKKKSQAGSTSKHGNHGSRRNTAEAVTAVASLAGVANAGAVQDTSSCADSISVVSSSQQPGERASASSSAVAAAPGPGLYCLTFEVTFPCSGMYLICNCYPYTYSDLQHQLAAMQLKYSKLLPAQVPVVRSLLCYTLAGQRCDLLTVTDFSSSAAELASREYVIITARVHPGETCGSWIMQGVIDFLLSSDPIAQQLRQCFVFKLVPMLNPDGAIVGNYRSSLAGVDLNRQWDKPVRQLHPTIYHTRKLLEALAEPGRLALTIDIHGHSCKTDALFYGCEPLLAKQSRTEQEESKAAVVTESGPGERVTDSPSRSASGSEQLCVTGRSWQPRGSRSRTSQEVQIKPSAEAADVARSTSPAAAAAVTGTSTNSVARKQDNAAPDAVCAVQRESCSGSDMNNTAEAASMRTALHPAESSVSNSGSTMNTESSALTLAAVSRLRVRMLPYLAAQLHPGCSLAKCNFKVQKSKAGTARVVAARQLGVPGAYTLEASLAGGSAPQAHFGVRDYLDLGRSLVAAVGQLAEADDQALLDGMVNSVDLSTLPASGTL